MNECTLKSFVDKKNRKQPFRERSGYILTKKHRNVCGPVLSIDLKIVLNDMDIVRKILFWIRSVNGVPSGARKNFQIHF